MWAAPKRHWRFKNFWLRRWERKINARRIHDSGMTNSADSREIAEGAARVTRRNLWSARGSDVSSQGRNNINGLWDKGRLWER